MGKQAIPLRANTFREEPTEEKEVKKRPRKAEKSSEKPGKQKKEKKKDKPGRERHFRVAGLFCLLDRKSVV